MKLFERLDREYTGWRTGFWMAVVYALVLAGLLLFAVSRVHASAVYNETVRIVDSLGNVISGVASATTANYQETVRVVDSTGKVLNSFVSPGVFNVASYGAKCDGTTDDTAAFQAAINAATVLLEGNYIAGTVTAPSNVYCKLNGAITVPYGVSLDFSGTQLDFTGLPTSAVAIQLGSSISSPRLERQAFYRLGTMQGPGASSTSTGVLLGGATNVGQFSQAVLEDSNVQKFGTALKEGFNAFVFTVRNNHFSLNGTGYNEVTGATNCGENVIFIGNTFNASTSQHANFGGGCISDDFTIIGNSFDDSNGVPFVKVGTSFRMTFIGNHWENDGSTVGEIATATNPAFVDITQGPETLTILNDTMMESVGAGGTPSGIPISWDNAANLSGHKMIISGVDFRPATARNLVDCTNCTNPGGMARLIYTAGINDECSRIGTSMQLISCVDGSTSKATSLGVNVTPSGVAGEALLGADVISKSTIQLPGVTGSATDFFTRGVDNAGSRALDSGISNSGAWIQSRDKNSYAVDYPLLLNPNGLGVQVCSTTFANLATVLPTNGLQCYCSDCTIANPCAGAGTGAIAKRLNAVNVCN